MNSLFLVITLVAVYFVMRISPFAGGLVAMIPIKIIAALLFAHDLNAVRPTVDGLLLGSGVTTLGLFILWCYLRATA